MVDYLPRSAWGARPAGGGPGNLTVSRVEGVALHWPGMGDSRVIKQADVARRLRGWQDYHMDDRGWSDIAYQVAIDQAGRAWTLRGLRTQSGANGSTDVNERFGAILLVVGTGEHPTPEMIATTRDVIRDFRQLYPNGTAIRPHSAVRPDGTDCPGDLVRGLITAGAFNPGQAQEEGLTVADVQKILDYQRACCIQIQDNTRQHVNRAIAEVGKLVQTYAVAVNNYTRQIDMGSDKERAAELAKLQAELEAGVSKVLAAMPAAGDAVAPDLPTSES